MNLTGIKKDEGDKTLTSKTLWFKTKSLYCFFVLKLSAVIRFYPLGPLLGPVKSLRVIFPGACSDVQLSASAKRG
jgi:hypothetical protein